MNKILLVVSISLILSSCKHKDDPTPLNDTPTFKLNGILDAVPVEIMAGVNNYYMYTDVSRENADSLNIYSGTFRQNNCASCKRVMQFSFRGGKSTANGNYSDTTEFFNQGIYSYYNSSTTALRYLVSFKSLPGSSAIQSYKWGFGDGATSVLTNPEHYYLSKQSYSVSLATTTVDGCQTNISNILNTNEATSACNSLITLFKNGNNVVFSCTAYGSSPYTFSWDFGDGSTSAQQSPFHTFTTSGIHNICYTMIDNVGCQYATCMNVRTGDTLCDNNFYRSIPSEIPNTKGFSTITIKWTDDNGNIFTSENINQPTSSYYKIVSADNYKANGFGQPVKKLHIQFTCLLYNSTLNKTILAENMDGIIGIAY